MRQPIAPRPSSSALSHVLFVFALFVLLLVGSNVARATSLAAPSDPSIGDPTRHPNYHRSNAEYWRVKGERMTVRRHGLLGLLLPKHSRHELAEKRRADHRAPASTYYRSRKGGKHTLWQAVGLAD